MKDREAWWHRRKLLLILVVLLLALGGGKDANAQSTGPTMTVSAAWKGMMRWPGWTELLVTLENEGGDWTGYVTVRDQRWDILYQMPVQLPAHAHKVYRLPIFLYTVVSLEVRLLDEHGEAAAEESLVLHAASAGERVCIAADPLTTMRLEACDKTLVLQRPEMMPEMPAAWDTVDLLLMHDFPTAEMSDAQRTALRAWVAGGGHLLLLSGPAVDAMVEGLPSSLRPSCETSQRVTLVTGETVSLCRKVIGLGTVDLADRVDVSELAGLWSGDKVPSIAFPFIPAAAERQETLSAFFPSIDSLFTAPRSIFPSFLSLLLFAFLYLLLLIPLPYLITRRLHRPMLTWVLIPAFALLASLCVFLWLSGFASGSFPLTHEMTFAFVPDSEEPVRLLSFGATLASRQRRLEWSVPGAFRPGQGSFGLGHGPWMGNGVPYEAVVQLGTNEAEISTAVPQGILTWGWESWGEAPSLNVEGRFAGQEYVLEAESEAPLRLQAVVLYNEYLLSLGETLVEGHVEVSRPFTEVENLMVYHNYVQEFAPCAVALLSNETMFSSIALISPPMTEEPAPSSAHCYLIADVPPLAEGTLPSVEMGGKIAHESCYIYLIPCPRQDGAALMPLPSGRAQVVDGGGWISEDASGFDLFVSDGARYATLAFTVPPFLQQGRLKKLALTLAPAEDALFPVPTPSGPVWAAIGRIALWDWEREEWVEVGKPAAGDTLEVAPAAAFVSEEGEIRLRLEGVAALPVMRVTLSVQFEGE